MKKWIYLVLFACTSLISCEKENEDELELNSEEFLASQEYFRAQINEKPFEVLDPETMGGFIYPSPTSGIMTFDLYGTIWEGDNYEELNFKICFYDGPGIYHTGTGNTVSWADYYINWRMWFNDSNLEDPGTVIVTKQDDNFIEGTFDFNAYNYEEDSFVHVTGEFKVLLEESVHSE